MRDYKFRGKRVDNGEWHYGFYREFTMPNCWKHQAYRDGVNYYIDAKDTNECHLVILETVGQYTGLKDKNGKEIYEGDIIEYKKYNKFMGKWVNETLEKGCDQIVKFDEDLLRFGTYYNPISELKDIVVIGNIHENPELLKV